jgi:outer membrane beta-barrel protein
MVEWRTLVGVLLAAGLVGSSQARAAGDEPAPAADGERGSSTVVASRVPKLRPLKVRNKFFLKTSRLEITPQIGYITTNALNDEMLVGAAVTYHFDERAGFEVMGSYGVLGGTNNTKDLALAVLRLKSDDYRLESVDPGLFLTGSLVWTPMYGKINPFGLAVINLDFYFVLGLGYGLETVEMLKYEEFDEFGRESASLATEAQPNHLFLIDVGFGAEIYASRSFSLRLEGRVYLTFDQILDPTTDLARARMNAIGPLVNRLSCDTEPDPGEFCRTAVPATLALSVGGSFWVPGDKVVRQKLGNP